MWKTFHFENGKFTSSRVFKELFYGHTVLRPSCYECPYKSVIHPGDIAIADYWGIEKAAPEFDDNKGVSLVLVNNEAGEKIFEKVKERLIWKQTKLEDSMQPPLKAPFPKPDNREQFWSDFENKSFEYVAKKYGGIGLKNDAKLLLRKIKRKIKKLGGKRWKERFQYYIKEKKNAVGVQRAMLFVRKMPSSWWKMKRALNTRR